MMYILSMIILIFFAVIGLCAFITALADLVHSGTDSGAMLLLNDLGRDDAEIRVRRAARICRENRCGRLICVCDDEGIGHICNCLRSEYPFIEVMGLDDAKKLIVG